MENTKKEITYNSGGRRVWGGRRSNLTSVHDSWCGTPYFSAPDGACGVCHVCSVP